jgi:hypothetical protein
MICDDADIRERPVVEKTRFVGTLTPKTTISGTEKMSEIVEGIQKGIDYPHLTTVRYRLALEP